MDNIASLSALYKEGYSVPRINAIKKHRNYEGLRKLYIKYIKELSFSPNELRLIADARNAALQGWVVKPGMTGEEVSRIIENDNFTLAFYSAESIISPLIFIHDIYEQDTVDFVFELSEAYDLRQYELVSEMMFGILDAGIAYEGIDEGLRDIETIVMRQTLFYRDLHQDLKVCFCVAYISCMTFWEVFLSVVNNPTLEKIDKNDNKITKSNCIQLAFAIGLLNDLLIFIY